MLLIGAQYLIYKYNDKLYVSIQLCFFDACNLMLGICLE